MLFFFFFLLLLLLLLVFHISVSLSESMSPQVSGTFLSIMAVLIFWMVSTFPPTSSPFNNPLVTVPKAPNTIGTVVTFMFHSFFQFPCKAQLLILLFTFFQFYSVVSRNSKGDNFANSLFFCWLIIIIIVHSLELFLSALADVFHWGLSDSKFPQVSRTLLSILAVLNNAVVWMVSTCPPTSKSSSPFSNPLVSVPNAPITTGIIVTCMFLSFFNSLARSRYLSFFSHSSSFILWSAGTAKSTILQVLFLFVDYY